MKRKLFILAVLVIYFTACSQKPQTCKEIFDHYYEKNVEVFMTTVTSQDTKISPEEARRIADYLLHGLYLKDSTYVKMSGADQDKFIATNYPILMENYKVQREAQLKFFADYFDKNIERFTAVMQGTNKDISKEEAEILGAYLLRGLFNINPEFINMNEGEQEQFVSKNLPDLMKKYKEKKS